MKFEFSKVTGEFSCFFLDFLFQGGCKLNEKILSFFPLFFLILAFVAGCFFTGFFFYQLGSGAVGKLDKRYNSQHARATETIGRLEAELERERGINRQLLEHNTRARELAGDLTRTTDRNVRNLQDAIAIIGEIRAKLKVLADFYAGSDPGDSDN